MKKVLAIALVLMLCLVSSGFAGAVAARPFTAGIGVDTSKNIYVAGYYGLWSMPLDVNGAGRSMCVYVPKNYFPCCDMLLVLAPDGKTAEEFANESGWMALSEEYGFGIGFLEAKDGKWNLEDPEEELAYYVTAINVFGNREIIDFGEASLYMIGYGEGASMAHVISLNYSSMLAGVVTMGGGDTPKEYIRTAGNALSYPYAINVDFETRIEGSYNKDVVLPIWIIGDGEENTTLIEYWKTANDVTDEGLTNAYGRVYNQNKLSLDETINNRAISRVWISEIEGAASYFDADFEEYVWTNFFTKIRRFSSEPNGALRVGYTLDEIGMVQRTITVDGVTRYYLVYVPTSYNGAEKVPLVVACHGHAARAEVYAQHSEWWRVAEARGFIVVLPQGSRCTWHPVCGCTMWNSDEIDMELDYVKLVLAEVEDQYAIDTDRVYCTGHSNGGQFTGLLAENMPGVFAAAANVGGTYALSDAAVFAQKGEHYMPFLTIVGEHDLAGMGIYEPDNLTYEYMRQRLTYNGLEDVEAYVKDTGAYILYTYSGSEKDVPLTEVMVNKGFHHSYVPQYSWRIWDDFFSNFSRGSGGASLYCGVAIE